MTSLPSTYKAAVAEQVGGPLTLKDVELKHPSAGEVLVKVLACGVCFSDTAVINGHLGQVFPRVPGHELVGDVVELGAGVSRVSVGDRVGGPWHGGHDGECRACRRGLFQMCDAKAVNGVSRDGGFAEYALLRSEAVVRIPRDADPAEVAPMLCAGVTVFNSVRKLRVEQGAIAAVQGLGGLGHLAVQFLHHMGYEVVCCSSGGADKAEFARKLGATHYVNTSTQDVAAELMKLGGADIVVQTAPNPALYAPLIEGLAPGGKLLAIAPVGPAPINTATLVAKGASVHGWPSGHAQDSEDAIRFAVTHGVKCMVERYPFADIQRALDDLVAGKPRFRNVLVMQ